MSLAFLAPALEDLRARGLLRSPTRIDGPPGPRVRVDGREVVLLCSNSYLGLTADPAATEAAIRALRERGIGSGASRLICGESDLHRALEERLAAFVGLPSALTLTSGYHANTGLLPALAAAGDHILSDELNHASLVDGCRLSRATVHIYRHGDASEVERVLAGARAQGARRLFVVTESLFSMEGDLAPLREIRQACDRHDATLVVDEAHALGVLGRAGRGACDALGVRPDIVVGTLGKAFGSFGAFIAGPAALRPYLVSTCRPFIFTTAPPPAVVAASLAAVDQVLGADERRERLRGHIVRMRAALADHVPAGASPILPIRIGAPERTMALSRALLERGFFVQGIRPPTVPPGTSRLRLTLMATHDPADLDAAAKAIRELLA